MASNARRPVLILLIVAFAVRGLALWGANNASLVLDEVGYEQRARALLAGQGFVGSYQSWVRHPGSPVLSQLPQYPGAFQPPGQTVFMAAALALGGGSLLAVKLLQLLLGTLAVWLVYALGRRWIDAATGLLAGGFAALYPNLIAFSHTLWSETLFISLFLGALLALTGAARLPSAGRSAVGGVLWGLACLTRATLLPFLPVFIGWWIWRHREQARAALLRGLLVVGVVLLVVAPWSLRNTRLHGGFVAIDTNAPLNFWRGNGPDAFAGREAEETLHYAWPFDAVPVSPVASRTPRRLVERARIDLGAPQPSDLEIIRYASREARRAILSDPGTFFSRIPTRLFDMWNPTSFLLRHLQIGAYGEVPGWVAVPISSLAVLAYLLVVALACVGLVLGRRRPETWLVLLIVGWFSAITAVSFGLTRFRLPLMPLLMLLAAGACTRWLPKAAGSPRVAAGVALAVVSLGLAGCGPSDDRPLPQGPNVLWVVWDTVRSDRMGLYGHEVPTTPRLDAWARDARVFDNAISTAGYTIPSHASMFTGLLPSEHCANNDKPRLADELVTLAELMWDAGYRTYLYSENPNVSADPYRNMAQGFEQTEHPWSPDRVEQAFEIVWNKLGNDASDRELKERLSSARERGQFPPWGIKAAGPLAERALLEWLEDGDAKRPFFAFVNYMEAHGPRIAPRSYRQKLMSTEDVERSYKVDRSWNSMWEYVFGFRDFSDEKIRLTRAAYDASLLELDDLFGDLLDALESGGWLENTIVIVTSDHGEHLGEQHMLDHQYTVYEPVLRVPLIVHYPKRVEAGREPRPVSNFDIFPTVLELTGVAPPPGLDSAARSLLDPLDQRGRLAEEPAASTIGITEILKNHPDWNPEPHRRQLRAWTDGDWKYIWRSKGLPSLYDLSSDPMEQTDIISREPERAVALSRALDTFRKPRSACVISDAATPVQEMSEQQRARLEALGYLSPDSGP